MQAETTGYPMDLEREYISAISYIESGQPSPLAKGCWLCCAFEHCKGRTNESVNEEARRNAYRYRVGRMHGI